MIKPLQEDLEDEAEAPSAIPVFIVDWHIHEPTRMEGYKSALIILTYQCCSGADRIPCNLLSFLCDRQLELHVGYYRTGSDQC